MNTSAQNNAVEKLDKGRFMGKWYSVSSIPTIFDRDWRETIENYSLADDGHIDVSTTYRKKDSDKIHTVSSKLFPVKGASPGEMKAQFVWPFKAGYRIIELAEDYSYTVIGHPGKKYLFIMSRTPAIESKFFNEIVARCRTAGYDVDKLVSQEHRAL